MDSGVLQEYAYNNNYHASIRCASFEAFYGRRSPLCWDPIHEKVVLRPDWFRKLTKHLTEIPEHMLAAQSRQKGYANVRRRGLGFCVGISY